MEQRCTHVMGDILGGTPRRCKRSADIGKSVCWQHSTERSSPKTPPKSPKTLKRTSRGSPTSPLPRSPARTPGRSPNRADYVTPGRKKKLHENPRVSFNKKITVRKIPQRDKSVKGGIAWAKEVSDLQAICAADVMGTYGIWDSKQLNQTKDLNDSERVLIRSCLDVMEGLPVKNSEVKLIHQFSNEMEERKNTYRKKRITAYSQEAEKKRREKKKN